MKSAFTLSVLLFHLILATALYGAQAVVIKADEKTVRVDVGADREIEEGMAADVYRQTEAIIHPVTGEDLGSPKVKIARIEIREVGPNFSVGRYVVRYAPVRPGDLVEGLEAAPSPEEQIRMELSQARSEIKALARSLADEINANKKAIADLRGTLRNISSSEKRIKGLVNAVRNMRERLVTYEGRLVTLEEQQQAMIVSDTAEVKTLSEADLHELKVLRRGDEDAIYLTVGDRVYRLSFEENRLIEEPLSRTVSADVSGETAPPAEGGMVSPADELFGEEDLGEGEKPWYLAYWWVALPLGLLGAVVLFLVKLMGRKQEAPAEEEEAEVAEAEFPEVGDVELMPDVATEPEEVEALEEEQ